MMPGDSLRWQADRCVFNSRKNVVCVWLKFQSFFHHIKQSKAKHAFALSVYPDSIWFLLLFAFSSSIWRHLMRYRNRYTIGGLQMLRNIVFGSHKRKQVRESVKQIEKTERSWENERKRAILIIILIEINIVHIWTRHRKKFAWWFWVVRAPILSLLYSCTLCHSFIPRP